MTLGETISLYTILFQTLLWTTEVIEKVIIGEGLTTNPFHADSLWVFHFRYNCSSPDFDQTLYNT